jgi:hypothetical protein
VVFAPSGENLRISLLQKFAARRLFALSNARLVALVVLANVVRAPSGANLKMVLLSESAAKRLPARSQAIAMLLGNIWPGGFVPLAKVLLSPFGVNLRIEPLSKSYA